MILDVGRRTPAARAGLQSRDIVLKVNGMPVNTQQELANILQWAWQGLHLLVLRDGKLLNIALQRSSTGPVGIIAVPGENASRYLLFQDDTVFMMARRWWRWLKRQLTGS